MKKESQIQIKIKKLSSFCSPVADIATAASSIPEKLILEPTIPIGVYVQEACNIHLFIQDDRDLIVPKGMNWNIVEELPRRIEFLQTCETLWWKARFSPSPAVREFQKVKELATATASELLRDFEFLADDHENIATAVRNIKKGSGDLDLTFDIKALCLLCENQKDKLAAIGSNPQLLIDINYCNEIFPQRLVEYELDQTYSKTLRKRNCAYTLLLVAIEEIRRCARHAFWNNKKHLQGYQSEYFRRQRA
ncbi:MAG TPA: hypothetical protein VHO70_04085 [Chitinispirillaceae bacterium]|nr:hypothetical protein [Chitinispirillaceae bacterium]